MAPGEPSQKTRRDRATRASKTAKSASDPGPGDVAAPAPKRRERPRKSDDEGASQASEPADTAPRKTGRSQKAATAVLNEEDSTQTRPRKRTRGDGAGETENAQEDGDGGGRAKRVRSSADAPQQRTEPEEQIAAEGASRRNRSGRQPAGGDHEKASLKISRSKAQADSAKAKPAQKPARPEQPETGGQRSEKTKVRRSARERRSVDDKPWWAAPEAAPEAAGAEKAPSGQPKKPKHGRSSLAEVSVFKAQNKAASPQVGRQDGKRGPEQPSTTRNASGSGSGPPEAGADQGGGEERRERDGAQYRRLTSRTRQIPRATISARWTPLSPQAVAAVSALVADASRPVLLRLRDRGGADARHAHRHAQAQTILAAFAARLHAKLVKGMPFPPPTLPSSSTKSKRKKGGGGGGGDHEAELDFEKTVDAIGRLEGALDPLLHSVALLKAERDREERELEREYKLLRRLEGNARDERREWRERGRRGHVLAGGVGLVGGGGGGAAEGGGHEVVVKGDGGREVGGVFTDLQEEELLALSQQIASHMESMRSNLSQIEGVLPAIAKSRAALQGALCRHLEPEQYNQVLLG